ncbi:MAG: response regulator [Ginsengibacter sp.]
MNRILIVEDNHDVLWVVKIVLKRYGFKVMAIPRGEDVMDKTRTFRPHLILLDVVLSGVSGIDVCNELKANEKTKDIPIIMFSAHANMSDILKRTKPDDFIAKPFDVNELVKKIKHQVEKHYDDYGRRKKVHSSS